MMLERLIDDTARRLGCTIDYDRQIGPPSFDYATFTPQAYFILEIKYPERPAIKVLCRTVSEVRAFCLGLTLERNETVKRVKRNNP